MEILKVIKSIRESFPDATIIYSYGACYGFYKILKKLYPKAEAYTNSNSSHILTKIDGKFYDISGELLDEEGKPKDEYKKLNKKQHEFWETIVCGQRVEYIIKKYNQD